MSLPSIVQRLRQSPRVVAAVALVALVAAVLTTFRISGLGLESRRHEVGYARTAALVDTKPSQAIDASSGGSAIAELRNRATLLADLMTRSPLRETIADRAGVPRDTLLTERPMNLLEKRLTAKEVTRSTVGPGDRDASILYVGVHFLVEGDNPFIGIDVRAPDAATAARLADAAVAVIRDYVERTPVGGPTRAQPLAVEQLEPATATAAVTGPSPVVGVLVAIVVLGIGAAGIVVWPGLRSRLRRRPLALDS